MMCCHPDDVPRNPFRLPLRVRCLDLGAFESMTYSPISDAEEFARELLDAATAKASAIESAGNPPLFTFPQFADKSDPAGLVDDAAAVIELVLKQSLACEYMRQGDTRKRPEIECEFKQLGHDAREILQKLNGSTQKAIQVIYSECQRGYDDFASTYGRMADFEEMLAWVRNGPHYRYTTVPTVPHVPIHRCWSPLGSSGVKDLPSFPGALVEWATKEFENTVPVRSTRETIEALLDLSRRRGDAALPDTADRGN